MTKFEKFDLILKRIPDYPGKNNLHRLCNELFGEKGLFAHIEIESEIVKCGLVEKVNSILEDEYQITQLGKSVISDYGGYQKYLEIKKGRLDKEEREIKKSRYDLSLTKRQYFTFWLLFIFSIMGGVSGFFSIKFHLHDRQSFEKLQLQMLHKSDSFLLLYTNTKAQIELQELTLDSLRRDLNKKH